MKICYKLKVVSSIKGLHYAAQTKEDVVPFWKEKKVEREKWKVNERTRITSENAII